VVLAAAVVVLAAAVVDLLLAAEVVAIKGVQEDQRVLAVNQAGGRGMEDFPTTMVQIRHQE
jgi:hypothetical protein